MPAAAVVLKEGAEATENDILAHGAARIAQFKRLRRVVIVDELPLTASGKVRRAAVKEEYAAALASK